MRISDWSSDVCSSDLYEFRPVIYADIEARVEAFWQSIRKGKAPKPEYSRDGDVIAEIYSNATDDVKDLRADNRAVMLAAEYLSAKQMEKQSAAEADAIKAELLEKLGERSEEHTSELQSLMRTSYAVFCLKKKQKQHKSHKKR